MPAAAVGHETGRPRVWPRGEFANRFQFDCGKLDPWILGFNHMNRRGLRLHLVHDEPEKDQLLDLGDLGPTLKLQLPPGTFTTHWFAFRYGGDLIPAEPIAVPGQVALGGHRGTPRKIGWCWCGAGNDRATD